MWPIPLLSNDETLGGLAMYYNLRVPLGPRLKIHSVLLVTDNYRSPRIFYYVVVSCMLKTARYIIKIRVKAAVSKSI